MGQTPVMMSNTPRTKGNLDAMEMIAKNHVHTTLKSEKLIKVNLTDLNLARAFNRAARGEDVKLAPSMNKKFQKVARLFPKDGDKQKVMVHYFPNRLWPDKFWTNLEKLGTLRYEAALYGS